MPDTAPLINNAMAMTELLQFQRVLPCVVIDKYQDWEFRQRFQYEALKGLIAEDFLSMKDFKWAADTCWSNPAWVAVVRPVIAQNPVFRLSSLIKIPGMGWIGHTLATYKFLGFTKIFTDALSILRNKISLPGSDS